MTIHCLAAGGGRAAECAVLCARDFHCTIAPRKVTVRDVTIVAYEECFDVAETEFQCAEPSIICTKQLQHCSDDPKPFPAWTLHTQ